MKNKFAAFLLFILAIHRVGIAQNYEIDAYNGQIVSACTGFFYDSGGPNGNYTNNENYVVTFCSSSGQPLYISFTNVNMESNYDFLYVYNGIGTNQPLIGTYSGSNSFTVSSSNANNCLTFRFRSDGSTTYSGWKGTINCGTPPVITNPGDCNSAIPVNCQSLVFHEDDITSGYGNIQELNSSNAGCLSTFEHNSRWYTFNVAQSGTFTFAINSNADYDWALYNLTGQTCQGIINGTVPMIRCNYSATTGLTGCNMTSTIISGNASASPWCQYVNVQAGQTWVLLVDKYSSGAHAYDLDFTYGGGSANIGVDHQPPSMTSMSSVSCGANTITVNFSELVTCTSINPTDFTITGPGGTTYSIVTATCTSSPSTQSATLQVNQPFTTSGTFQLNLVGSITDLCGNAASATSFSFNINGVSSNITNVVNEVCHQHNGSATVSATGGSGTYTYTWSTTPVQHTATASNLSEGSYTVTVADGNGCSSISTVTIQNQGTTQSTTFTPSAPAICNGANVAVYLSQGGNTYTWAPTNSIQQITADGDSVILAPTSTTTYTITIADQYGCSSDTNLTVVVHQPPQFSVQPSFNKCEYDTITINLNPAYTYNWAPFYEVYNTSPGVYLVKPQYSVIYTITATDTNGCVSSQQTNVQVNPTPVIQVTPNTVICPGAPTVLTASGASTYYWSPASYLSSTTGASVTASPTNITTYTVYGLDNLGCRSADKYVTLNMYPPLEGQILSSGGISEICPGESVFLNCFGSGSSGGPYTYTWSHGIGVQPTAIQVSPLTTTTYSCTISDNCQSPVEATFTVTVKPLPDISIQATTQSGCKPQIIQFTATVVPQADSIYWDFGDPKSGMANFSNQNPSAPHTYNTPGIYDITVSALSSNGCHNTIVFNDYIEIYPVPIAAFDWEPKHPTELDPLVNFENLSEGANYYHWDFADNTNDMGTSTELNPFHYYTYPGVYPVKLTVENLYGCKHSVTQDVIIDPYYVFYFPNAFTPNNDGINDKIGPKGNYFPKEYSFRVYNRWGELVFSTNDHNLWWDGRTPEGDDAPNGTYIYEVKFRNERLDLVQFNGYFTLLK